MAVVPATLEVIAGSNKGLKVAVQFNPQSLHVNHRQTASPSSQAVGVNSGKQGVSLQQTGYTADVTMELLFDTSQSGADVRNTTLKIAAMIQPQSKGTAVPFVQFSWGTFIFKGAIQSMNETLDLFSEQGVPLRATVSLSMTELELDRVNASTGSGAGLGFSASVGVSAGAGVGFSASVGVSAGADVGFSASASLNAGVAVGTTPLTLSQSGDTLQSLTGRAGINGSWKAVASANNIDNPRQMDPGTVLNLNASAQANIG